MCCIRLGGNSSSAAARVKKRKEKKRVERKDKSISSSRPIRGGSRTEGNCGGAKNLKLAADVGDEANCPDRRLMQLADASAVEKE